MSFVFFVVMYCNKPRTNKGNSRGAVFTTKYTKGTKGRVIAWLYRIAERN